MTEVFKRDFKFLTEDYIQYGLGKKPSNSKLASEIFK